MVAEILFDTRLLCLYEDTESGLFDFRLGKLVNSEWVRENYFRTEELAVDSRE
jgi:hypothetical protein